MLMLCLCIGWDGFVGVVFLLVVFCESVVGCFRLFVVLFVLGEIGVICVLVKGR